MLKARCRAGNAHPVGTALLSAALALFSAGHADAFSLWDYLFGPGFKDSMASACDDTIKARLKAPSTYKRVKVTLAPARPATLDEYLGWDTPSISKRDQKLIQSNPDFKKTHDVEVKIFNLGHYEYVAMLIDYDAANGFGTPIRSTSLCTLVTTTPDKFTDLDKDHVKVDGYDSMDWDLEQIDQLTGN